MESIGNRSTDNNEISLKQLFAVLWAGRWLIVIITIAFSLTAGITAWLTTKKYQATIVISPISDSSSSQLGGLSSLASQFGGLASLAGISVSGDSKKSESMAVLRSQALTEQYIQNNNLLPVLYQKLWDAQTRTWTVTDPEKIPTLWKANELFKSKIRTIATDAKTGLITLTITWKDPKLATTWANGLVELTNAYLRRKAIEQSERNIAYLNDQAAKTDGVNAKQAIYSILQTEINKVMLAKGSDEYAFKVLDPAFVPEKPSAPQKLVWLLIGMLSGALVSTLIVLIRYSWRKNPNQLE